jgi:hypothetical protein
MKRYYRIAITGVFLIFALPASSQHPVCIAEIVGATLDQTPAEIETAWRDAGLTDITCDRRIMARGMTCEQRRAQSVIFATQPTGDLVDLGDRVVTLGLNAQTGAPYQLDQRMRVDAPESLVAYDEDRSWEGWSHAELIASKIATFCDAEPEEELRVRCDYARGVKITVLIGSPMDKVCEYTFEARYTGANGPTPPDHVIVEQIVRY